MVHRGHGAPHDWDNPRFLPGINKRFETDLDAYKYLDTKYIALTS